MLSPDRQAVAVSMAGLARHGSACGAVALAGRWMFEASYLGYSRLMRRQIKWPAKRKGDNHRVRSCPV
jgi:hypothetical protein